MNQLSLILSAYCLLATISSAEPINWHFNSPEEIAKFNPNLKNPGGYFEKDKALAGGGAFKGDFRASLPENATEGVLTFWIYDDQFEEIAAGKLRQITLGLTAETDGKKQSTRMMFRRNNEGWRLGFPGEAPKSNYYALGESPNHGGWTRIDIVNPPGDGPQPLTFYIDGYKAYESQEKFIAVTSVGTDNIPYVDEFSFNPDAASFRPNPVRSILPGEPYGNILLKSGEKLSIGVELDPKGARSKSGELETILLDGRGETLVCAKTAVDWKKGSKLTVELPTPPRSGLFWIETRYREAQAPVETARRRVNLQFLTPGFAQSAGQPLELFRHAWDFLPIGQRAYIISGPSQENNPTPEELAAPSAPPADWSQAEPLRGLWLDFGSYHNIGRTYHAGWYHQKVEVPASWKKQKVMLEIEGPETIATVFANGKQAGIIEWPGGKLDLTTHAAPGNTLDLAIHVAANPLSGYFKLGREYFGEKFEVSRFCKRRGLAGDVRLYPVANTPHIDGVAIRPSVAKKELVAVFELSNLTPGKSYQIKSAASVAGKVAKALPDTQFTATAASQTVEAVTAWEDPVLWELNAPYLYDFDAALLDAKGKTLGTLWPERFGFRDITGNGPDLKLNGRPVTLFVCSGDISGAPEHARWAEKYGFSNFYMGEGRENARLLDEAGKTCTGERTHMEVVQKGPLDMAKNGKENDPKLWAEFTRILEYANKIRRNHPGIFFHRGVLGGGVNGNGGMYNPAFQNGTWVNEPTGSEIQMKALAAGRRIKEILNQLDPTRLVTAQDSGSVNDTMHITEYAGFLPIQEMIEKSEYWRTHSRKPFLIEEQSAPMFPNWTDACSQGEGWNGVPCFAEWASITHGDEAYIRTPLDETFLTSMEDSVASKRQKIIDTIKNPLERDAALAKIRMQCSFGLYNNRDEVLHNIIWKERIRDEVLNWRANHLAMLGFFFSNFGPRLDLCYREYQAPLTGLLAGTEKQPSLRTHIYAPGETLERGAILLNNGHKPEALTCQWKLELEGKTVAEGAKTETVPGGGTVFIPIHAEIPAGTADQSGQLSVTFLKDGATIRSDAAEIDVIVPRAFENRWKIALIDPEGDSAKALEAAGIPFQLRCFDEDFSAFDTVVFGRRAFNYEFNAIPEGLDLAKLMSQGKRVLILEQDEATLRDRFKLRTEYISPRDAFGRIGGSPLLDGLPDRILKNWRGTATLTDGYAAAREKKKPNTQGVHEFGNGGNWLYNWNDGELHPRPMKWGNTHNVATVTVIKPDLGNFRTLIDCAYGSNYAAAWEFQSENGTIVFNQIDVSGRTESGPEAVRYLQNLVRYTAGAPKQIWRRTVYLGGEKGAGLLQQLGIPNRALAAPSEAQADTDLLVVGDASGEQLQQWKDGIAGFAKAGGAVFSLPRTKEQFDAGWTPFAVKAEPRTVNHTVIGKPAAPLLAGLGNADLYWKGNIGITAIQSAEGSNLRLGTGVLTSVPWGKGQYVLCQIEPSAFGDIQRDHWLKPSKQQTERMIRTLLTNLGAKMEEPKMLARARANEELDYTLDLTGSWKVISSTAAACPAKGDANWRDIRLPGSPQKEYPQWKGLKGGFWFRRELSLGKALPADSPIRVLIGCVSGANILYINGEKVARTDSETDVNSVAATVRDYVIPANVFKQGVNEVTLRVEYDTNAALGMRESTGEISAPMELKVFKTKAKNHIPEPLALESRSECMGLAVQDPNAPCPNLHSTWKTLPWHRIAIPGFIQTQHSDWTNHTGYFWYWKQFTLKEPLPEEAQPVLEIGAVDDEDTVYFNGKKIGHTGKDTHPKDYWKVRRHYPIPRELFKQGQNANTLQILVNDLNVGGGIIAPFRILFEDPEVTQKRKLAERPYLYDVGRKDDPYWHHGF